MDRLRPRPGHGDQGLRRTWGYELVYPFALSHFWNALWDLAWVGIEMEIEELEGFQVTVTTRFDRDGPGWTTDYNYPGHYPYERAAAGTTTVAGWLRQRFRRQYGDTEVKVKRPDYSVAPGQLRLSTLREQGYAASRESAAARLREAGLDCSVFEARVRAVEGFDIRVLRGGRDVRNDKQLPVGYTRYSRRMRGDSTVSQWRAGRFDRVLPGYEVVVLDARGRTVHGRTLLSTVRATYQ